jgi:hypothetical protein
LKGPEHTNDVARKCQTKWGTMQRKAGAQRPDYTHLPNQAAKIAHQETAVKCGMSKGPPMPYYKYKHQHSHYKLHHDNTYVKIPANALFFIITD